LPRLVVFELRRLDTGGLVHQYVTEGAALAFVRDVFRIGGREQAACFALQERDEQGQVRTLSEGPALVRRALEDRAE
jgi:ATP-dependent 26S proteasome regulatory subunit